MNENELITIRVRLFASLKQRIDRGEINVRLNPDASLRDLIKAILHDFPVLIGSLDHSLASINHEYASEEMILKDGDEVGFFPPVSGGDRPPTILLITEEIPDLDEILQQLRAPDIGAAVVFTGFVRGSTPDSRFPHTRALFYEAYQPMAEKMMKAVADEIRSKWSQVHGIAIIQRIGKLDPMDITVVIACSAGHRDSGVFEAARHGIDRLKEIVPVWKKEIGPAGEEWVEGHYHPGRDGV